MFSLAIVALASLASSAHALAIPRSAIPPSYDTSLLEPYATYHARYMALDCEDQHETQFFNDCCHPMLAVGFCPVIFVFILFLTSFLPSRPRT